MAGEVMLSVDGVTLVDHTGRQVRIATKGYMAHGANASTLRPIGYASVEWHGTVQPNNAVAGDTWVDTT